MPKFTPKTARTVVAVRLTEDLLIEAGTWVAIPVDGTEELLQFTDDQMRAMYDVNYRRGTVTPRVTPPAKSKGAQPVKQPRLPTVEGFCRKQGGRVLYVLAKLGKPSLSGSVARHLNTVDGGQVSARLSEAVRLGLVSYAQGPGKGYTWTITEHGKQAVKMAGFAMFTDSELPVPSIP